MALYLITLHANQSMNFCTTNTNTGPSADLCLSRFQWSESQRVCVKGWMACCFNCIHGALGCGWTQQSCRCVFVLYIICEMIRYSVWAKIHGLRECIASFASMEPWDVDGRSIAGMFSICHILYVTVCVSNNTCYVSALLHCLWDPLRRSKHLRTFLFVCRWCHSFGRSWASSTHRVRQSKDCTYT